MIQKNIRQPAIMLLTKDEICQSGNLSLASVNRLLVTKKLKFIKIGKAVRIPESEWLRFCSAGIEGVINS